MAIGWQHRGVVAPRRPKSVVPSRAERLEAAYAAALSFLEAEFARASVLNGSDLRAAAARALIAAGMTPGAVSGRAEVDALTRAMRERGVRQDGQPTSLIWGREGERDEVRVTTALHVAHEGEAVALAQAAAADRSRALSSAALSAAVERSGLDFGDDHGKAQHAALVRLGTGGAVGVAVGVAGSGKTALLRPLVEAWKGQGDQVVGVAIAWRQTEPLKEAGIASVAALTGFLHGVRAGRISVGPRTVVVDELGQVGARQMLELLRLREQHGFRIVAVGDDKQCQGIEAGPVVNLMRRALGPEAVPEILSTRRQRTEPRARDRRAVPRGAGGRGPGHEARGRRGRGGAGGLRRRRAASSHAVAAAARGERRGCQLQHQRHGADQCRCPRRGPGPARGTPGDG